MNFTTELYTTWLDQSLFKVINMQKNGVVNLKHPLNSIGAKSTLHWKTPHITFIGIVNIQVFVNSNHLDAAYIPSRQSLTN